MPRTVAALIALLAVPAAASPWPQTGDVLVRFDAEPTDAELADLLADRRFDEAERALGSWPVFRLGLAGDDPTVVARALAADPAIRWATPETIPPIEPTTVDDEFFGNQWHLDNVGQTEGSLVGADINVLPAWEHVDGSGIVVGIYDSGVDTDHPDLDVTEAQMNLVTGEPDANPDPEDDGAPHGTAVAGLAVATGNNGIGVAGVAYGAQVLPIRLIGQGVTTLDIYNGFAFGADNGAAVVNNSWTFMNGDCDPLPSDPSMNDAMEYNRLEGRGGLGTVVVFSGGNQGCDAGNNPMLLQPGVIAIAGTNDRDRRPGYSSWGQHIDFAAPTGGGGGALLWTTDIVGDTGYNGAGEDNEYTGNMSGTSASAPVVAGTVALMIDANPRITEEQVRQVLCDTADKVDLANAEYNAAGKSIYYGCGRVNAGKAVLAVLNDAPPAPAWATEAPELMVGVDGLTWTQGDDPDGDALAWELELTWEGMEPPEGSEEVVPELHELTERRFVGLQVDRAYTAQVWAVDSWGRGVASELLEFTTIAVPEPVEPTPAPGDDDDDDGGGQACGSSLAGAGGVLLLPLLLVRRRR